jgi:hypothetical protein
LAALVVSPLATTASYTIVPGGAPVTVTVSTSGGTSTASFSGTAGQRISLNMGSVTITSTKVSILKPGGTNLVTPFTVTRSGSFFDVHTLPTTGTYKIVVDPKDTYTGKMVLTLYNVPADPSGPITADGTLATVTTSTPGQNGTFTFSGTAGQRISAKLSGVTYSLAKLRILTPPDSALLYPTALQFGPAGGFLEPKTLPTTGTYTLVVDPQLRATGAANVQLYTVANDPTTAATVGGAAVPAATTTPGQNAFVTFSATLNQRVSVKLTGSTYGSAKVTWRKPDGTALFSPSLAISPLGTFLVPRILTPAGTYTLFIDPQLAETGTVDVQVFNVPPDLGGAITPGTPLHVAIDNPGQNALYTFSGTSGQRLSLDLQNVTFEKATVSVLKPDGTALYSPASTVLSGGTGFREPVTLPVSGTYKVKVDPVDGTTGALDVGLYVGFADVSTTIVSNATPVTITTTVPGQNAKLTFAGTNAQRVSLKLTGVTMASAKVTLYKPDGVTKLGVTRTVGPSGDFVDTQSLTTTGTYKIVVDPQGNAVGSMTLTLYLVPADLTAPITANGSATTIAVATPGQNASLTFSGSANQRVFLKVTGATTATPPKVSLQRAGTNPIQYVFFTQTINSDPFYFSPKSVGATAGSFKIVFDPQGADTGGATFKLWTVPADVTGTLTPGSNSVTIGNVGQEARLTFAGTVGKTATLTFSSGTIAEATVKLYGTNGTTQLSSAYWVSSITTNDTVEKLLPATGTYTFWVDPAYEFTGSETFTLSLS